MYSENGLYGCVVPVGTTVLGIDSLVTTAAVHGEYAIAGQCALKRAMFIVTTAVVSTSVAPVVAFKKYPTVGSSTNAVTLASLTIPDATAAGKIVYKEIEPVELNPGNSIALETVTLGSGGSVAGAGYYAFELQPVPEVPANQSAMIASA